tara:strand:- start:79 stop:282 length:204 start_codon:yes stop_codon:yes gene_type:complete
METNFQEHEDYKIALQVLELIEDTVSYYCDENRVSGEKVWTMINALSETKLGYFPYDSDYEASELED